MGSSVQTLDKTGWGPAAMAREAKFDKWRQAAAQRQAWEAGPGGQAYREALANHPLAGSLSQLTDGSMTATLEQRFRFKSIDFGNGHREAVVTIERPNPERRLDAAIKRDLRHMIPRGLGDREANVEKAVRRAKQEVRHKCKAMAVNSLWTLTYRENFTDRDLVLGHLDRFRRRCVELFGEWKYVAVLEPQERGAWHIHLATHALKVRLVKGGVKLKSWDVMREVWRTITRELGGNFDEAKRRRWGVQKGEGKSFKSCSSIASYIAGYVAKDMQNSELNRKRYSASKGVEVPEAYRAVFAANEATFEGLIELCYAAVGERIGSAWFCKQRGVFFVESDDSRPG